MDEELLSSYWHSLSTQLWAIKNAGEWEWDGKDDAEGYSTFYDYTKHRWSLSKTRAKLLLNFGKFAAMCRREHLPQPDSPDNIAPILRLTQKKWMEAWIKITDMADGDINAAHCEAVIAHFNLNRRKRPPQNVIDQGRVKRAVDTLAEVDITNIRPPVNTEKATHNVIDLHQRQLNGG